MICFLLLILLGIFGIFCFNLYKNGIKKGRELEFNEISSFKVVYFPTNGEDLDKYSKSAEANSLIYLNPKHSPYYLPNTITINSGVSMHGKSDDNGNNPVVTTIPPTSGAIPC